MVFLCEVDRLEKRFVCIFQKMAMAGEFLLKRFIRYTIPTVSFQVDVLFEKKGTLSITNMWRSWVPQRKFIETLLIISLLYSHHVDASCTLTELSSSSCQWDSYILDVSNFFNLHCMYWLLKYNLLSNIEQNRRPFLERRNDSEESINKTHNFCCLFPY